MKASAVWSSPPVLAARSLLWTFLLPGVVTYFMPRWYGGLRAANLHFDVPGYIGLFLISCGLIPLLHSIYEFAHRGKGTLSPVDPPKTLVVSGLYRYVRNPMYVGVLSILLGETLLLRTRGMMIWAFTFFLMVNFWVLVYEEPVLERMFGASYSEYCRRVRRWLPRFKPY